MAARTAVTAGKGLRLLIVEDAAAEAELAVRHLASGGIACVPRTVADEGQFRSALKQFRPHVILSDFTLPAFDGLAALEIAREEAPDVPFIFLSGTIGEERAIEALRRGAVDYVLKTNPARLVPAVRRALREVEERARRRAAEREIARLTRRLKMQSGINSAVIRIRDRDELLREACRLAYEVGAYDRAVIFRVAGDGRSVTPWHWLGAADPAACIPSLLSIGDGAEPDSSLTGRALRTGEIALCADLTRSEPPVANREQLVQAGLRSLVVLPLIIDGAPVGALALASREAHVVSDEELRLLQDVAGNLSFALRYRQQEHAAQYLASFDPLTGLAKRALFCQRLDQGLRNRAALESAPTVVAFDVMHLSKVNDSFGRNAGDLLLQAVAKRLKYHIADDERVGYLGGGTFVLVLPREETSAESVTTLLENTVFREPFHIEGRVLRTSFRSGIARSPADGKEGNTLAQRAEAALKQAKEAGEQYLHYQIEMHSDIAERLALEHRLRAALDERQFALHYQPQVSLATGRIEGVEALLRWQDPERGLVFPGQFLPVLESSGMIVAVGEWVLRQAAEDCLRWRRAGLGQLRIAVNVSAQQIRRRTFAEQVLVAAQPCLAAGCGMDLEITETGLLHDVEGASRKLRELREAGLRIALDDFGTGYSSLGLLSKLPVDLVKIDRSFITGLPEDKASVTLVSSVIGLASAFGLKVVAEGVETPGQLAVLKEMGCDHSQGYLHSRPVPAEQLEKLLREPTDASSGS
ncbi:MAG TPA: EAL domain-containing protein [Steroidobacteraceae bacterium]|nr:EAL domain-containing protein [Steroidobacteraceae bacterium]